MKILPLLTLCVLAVSASDLAPYQEALKDTVLSLEHWRQLQEQAEGDYPCAQRLTELISQIPNGNADMLYYAFLSGKGINDMGQYQLCNKDPNARYLVLFVDALFAYFYMGLCVPATCSAQDFSSLKSNVVTVINQAIDNFGAGDTLAHIDEHQVEFVDSEEVNARARQPSAGTWVTLVFFILFILATAAATVFELMEYRIEKRRKDALLGSSSGPAADSGSGRRKPCWRRALAAFGLLKNYGQLMQPTTKNKEDKTDVLNGVRVLSMCWIIWGHTFYYYKEGPLVNPVWIADLIKSWEFTFMEVTPYAVDVFFMMTGFLGTYIMLSMMASRKGKTQGICKTYLHRYIRLLPLYVFIMLMFIFIVPLLADGPNFFRFNDLLVADCKKAWWAHLLYINNFYYPRPRGGDYCMGWTWYLPNDFQFFLFLPILVPIYYKNPKLSMLLFLALLVVCMVVEFAIVFHYKVSASLMKVVPEYWDVYYHKPWNRIAPFILGVFLGFMLYTYKSHKQARERAVNEAPRRPPCFFRFTVFLQNSCVFRWIMYAIGTTLILMITLLNHSLNNEPEDWGTFIDGVYTIFARPAYVFGVLCFIYPVMVGQAPIVHALLGWKGWTPFAKVTYAAYLVHPVFMNLETYNQQQAQYASWTLITLLAVAYIVLVFALSFFLSVIIEFPMINLEKEFLFPQKPRSKKPNAEPSRRVYGAGGLGAGSIDAGSDRASSIESGGEMPNGRGSVSSSRDSIAMRDLN